MVYGRFFGGVTIRSESIVKQCACMYWVCVRWCGCVYMYECEWQYTQGLGRISYVCAVFSNHSISLKLSVQFFSRFNYRETVIHFLLSDSSEWNKKLNINSLEENWNSFDWRTVVLVYTTVYVCMWAREYDCMIEIRVQYPFGAILMLSVRCFIRPTGVIIAI